MKSLLIKRGVAFGIDYLIIAIYIALLIGITSLIKPENINPIKGQFIGFITLTLPVFLYFYLTERSTYKGTIGKRIMNISVIINQEGSNRPILVKNILKFLPWEIAHIGVQWIVYYSKMEVDPPNWVWAALILPQIIVIGYIISLVVYKGEY